MRTTLLAGLIALTCAVAATAQPTPRVRPGPSPAEQQEILSYQLSLPVANRLLAALNALNQYVLSQPDWMTWVQQNMRNTREDQLRQLERDPKIMAILKQNGLSAREYAVGIVTLRQAIFKARDPNGPMAKSSIASAENLAFATANLKDLDARLRRADEVFIAK